jgi:hypothetical protein
VLYANIRPLYLYIVFTDVVREGLMRAADNAVLVVPARLKPSVDDLGDVGVKMEAQILHSIRVSEWVRGPIGVEVTLAGSFTGNPGQLITPKLQERKIQKLMQNLRLAWLIQVGIN